MDDYWGPWAWDDFAGEIGKVLPPAQYPIRELTFDHPIFKTMFTVTKIPQVPSWQYWSGSGGDTSEMGSNSAQAHMAAITRRRRPHHGADDAQHRHLRFVGARRRRTRNYFLSFSPDGYALGLNVALYAMTH